MWNRCTVHGALVRCSYINTYTSRLENNTFWHHTFLVRTFNNICIFFHLMEFRDYCCCFCCCCGCHGFLQFSSQVERQYHAIKYLMPALLIQWMGGNKSHSSAYFPGYMGTKSVCLCISCALCVCTVQSTRNFNAYNQQSYAILLHAQWLVQMQRNEHANRRTKLNWRHSSRI